jgi:hypothetical protein
MAGFAHIDPTFPDRIFRMAEAQIEASRVGVNAEAFAIKTTAVVIVAVTVISGAVALALALNGFATAAVAALTPPILTGAFSGLAKVIAAAKSKPDED